MSSPVPQALVPCTGRAISIRARLNWATGSFACRATELTRGGHSACPLGTSLAMQLFTQGCPVLLLPCPQLAVPAPVRLSFPHPHLGTLLQPRDGLRTTGMEAW